MTVPVVLVACGSQKSAGPAPARLLYTGGVFHREHWCPWDELDDARFGYQMQWLLREARRVAV